MAAKKKATAKPTRTGAETKSYTSASARMQAKGKAGQRSASAAHAGKSGKAGKTAIDSAEAKSGLRARNRLTSIGHAKNYPGVKTTVWEKQETNRNQNKGFAAGIPISLQGDFRGKVRYNSTQIQTSRGNTPIGAISRAANKALMAVPVTIAKLQGRDGRMEGLRQYNLGSFYGVPVDPQLKPQGMPVDRRGTRKSSKTTATNVKRRER